MATIEKKDLTKTDPYIFFDVKKTALDMFGNPRQSLKLLRTIKKYAHHAEMVKGDMVYYLKVCPIQMDRPKNELIVLMAIPNVGKELGYYIKFMD